MINKEIGNIINYENYDNSTTRNVFVATTDKRLSGTPTVNKLTSYAEGSESASVPHLVKIDANNLIVLWTREKKVYYVKIDNKGQKQGYSLSIVQNVSLEIQNSN